LESEGLDDLLNKVGVEEGVIKVVYKPCDVFGGMRKGETLKLDEEGGGKVVEGDVQLF